MNDFRLLHLIRNADHWSSRASYLRGEKLGRQFRRLIGSCRRQIHWSLMVPTVGDQVPITAERRAETLFSLLELLLPKRIAAEEFGDALEMIREFSLKSCPAWRIYLKLASTVFWVSINAVRELSGAMLGRKRA